MTKIAVVSDFSFQGSGYLNIMAPLCAGLSKLGHEVMVSGLGYRGEPHPFSYSIIPCNSELDSQAQLHNLRIQWGAEVFLVALDIPKQDSFLKLGGQMGTPVISIVPLENPPLTLSWSLLLQRAQKVFFISQMGANEAQRSGVESAEHLVVGMDTKSWRVRTEEEYTKVRKMLTISPDTLVILTVADNQERKNLSKAMEIVRGVKDAGVKVKFILVTRENSSVGWKLRDLALTYGIASETMIFERGLPFPELYSLYAMADVFLLTSKAEGLCMPVMEAMSVGIPVVATHCGALPELLGDGRGYLMKTEYSHIDPWGNSRRDFPYAQSGIEHLLNIHKQAGRVPTTSPARTYMESRTWSHPVQQVDVAIEEIINGKK